MLTQEFVEFILNTTKYCRHPVNIEEVLLSNKFKLIGEGCYKKVFYKKNLPWVVKLFRKRFYWYHDTPTWSKTPKLFEDFWLKYIYACRRFVIQPKVNNRGGTPKDAEKFFANYFKCDARIYDLHDLNVGYHDGKPVIIDYLYNGPRPKYRLPRI